MMQRKEVLDKGFIELIDWMGGDLTVVNSARISYRKHKDEFDEKDAGLINALARERHGTPFEHVVFQFHVKAPITVAREWFRHRIGSLNEISGRYTKLKQEFYVPDFIRAQAGKAMQYTFEEIQDENIVSEVQRIHEEVYAYCYSQYEKMLSMGVAKEQARNVLPVAQYTEWYWTVNCRSLLNFLSLRTAPQAMFEIRQYADAIEEMCKEYIPHVMHAFEKGGRVSP